MDGIPEVVVFLLIYSLLLNLNGFYFYDRNCMVAYEPLKKPLWLSQLIKTGSGDSLIRDPPAAGRLFAFDIIVIIIIIVIVAGSFQ